MTLITELTTDDEAVLVRTDFVDEASWRSLIELVMQPYAAKGSTVGLAASMTVVEDPLSASVGPTEVSAVLDRTGWWGLVFLQMPSDPEKRLMTFYSDEPEQQFLCPAERVAEVEVNLSIDNLGVDDYQEMFARGDDRQN